LENTSELGHWKGGGGLKNVVDLIHRVFTLIHVGFDLLGSLHLSCSGYTLGGKVGEIGSELLIPLRLTHGLDATIGLIEEMEGKDMKRWHLTPTWLQKGMFQRRTRTGLIIRARITPVRGNETDIGLSQGPDRMTEEIRILDAMRSDGIPEIIQWIVRRIQRDLVLYLIGWDTDKQVLGQVFRIPSHSVTKKALDLFQRFKGIEFLHKHNGHVFSTALPQNTLDRRHLLAKVRQ
jgi:hypothetical protein